MTQVDQKSKIRQALEFIPQVRQEISKVTWPTRKETIMTTVFVFIFAMVAATYFLLVDQVIYRVIRWIVGFGG